MKCPLCEGTLINGKTPYSFKGIYFGIFDAYVCTKCHESFIREKHLLAIEKFAKERGVWGVRVIPHFDVSTANKNGLLKINIPQLFNRYTPVPYCVTSVR